MKKLLIFTLIFLFNAQSALADCSFPYYLPTGSFTVSSSCGTTAGATDGVDNGSGTTNTANLTVNNATLTVNAGSTVAYGSVTIGSGGVIAINQNAGKLTKGPLYVGSSTDADNDGHPAGGMTFTTNGQSAPSGGVRKDTLPGNDISVSGAVTTADSGGYRVATFTGAGSVVVNGSGNRTVDVLVVGGGGGGGSSQGSYGGSGGGGAGGVVYQTSYSISGTTSVTVGSGGNGATSNSTQGSPGNNSVFGTITAGGGGGGGRGVSYNNGGPGGNGSNGGSGGGSGWNGYYYSNVGTSTGGGYSGGQNGSNNAGGGGAGGGGGGGAGAAGGKPTNSPNHNGGVGGVGVSNSITGSAVYYGGGGGGGGAASGGTGGNGGGGQGSQSASANGGNGTNGLGGGGGGTYSGPSTGGNGGSGVVIVRYAYFVVPAGSDCNDNNNTVWAATTCYQDGDQDSNGAGSAYTCMNSYTCSSATVGAVGTGTPITSHFSANNTDCNDSNNTVFASATCYQDGDQDAYGNTGSSTYTCMNNSSCTSATLGAIGSGTPVSAHFAANNTDCNDSNANVFASATCYVDGDNDGYGVYGGTAYTCMNNTACGSATWGAIGTGNPSNTNFSSTNNDRCDTDSGVNPAETLYHSNTNGCGNYDWNSDGATTKCGGTNCNYNNGVTSAGLSGPVDLYSACTLVTNGSYIPASSFGSVSSYSCGQSIRQKDGGTYTLSNCSTSVILNPSASYVYCR